jgi:hypothetical protein
MSKRTTFAIAPLDSPKNVSLWCSPRSGGHAGRRNFSVINGGWDGWFEDGRVHITETESFPAVVVWEGEVPDGMDYDEAIRWINERIA